MAARASMSRTAVAYVVTTMSASATAMANSSAEGRDAPWCTTTRRSGVNRAASAAQLPTTAAGAAGRVEETGPRQRLGLVGAQRADESGRPGVRGERGLGGALDDVVGPA